MQSKRAEKIQGFHGAQKIVWKHSRKEWGESIVTITRMVINAGPTRRKPKSGDTKLIRGVLHVRKQARCESGQYKGAMIVNNGRPVYEWVATIQQEGGKHEL
jgi:hypothetical protein